MNQSHPVSEKCRVSLHFAIRLEEGDEIDNNFGGQPATFEIGDGNMLPGFEQAMFGMVAGQKEIHTITPENGFGMPNPANEQRFKPSVFDSETELSPGVVMTFQDAANTDLPGVIKSVTEDEVIVDFNHPLAGRTLQFEVEILSVEPIGEPA